MFSKIFIPLILLTTVAFSQTFEDYTKSQNKAFEDEKKLFGVHQKSQDIEFNNYKEAQTKVFNSFKKEVGAIWEIPKVSTKTKWVAYSKDKKTRTDVDFNKTTITVETLASSEEEAKIKLQNALKKVVTVDNKTFTENDPLEQKLAKIKKPFHMIDEPPKDEPLVSNMIFTTKPTKQVVKNYIYKKMKSSKIKVKKSSIIKKTKVYSITIKMPKDALVRKSKQYYKNVKQQATKEKLPLSLVFAIIHSESSFNPRARSYVPAYGLMQIVPRTAGLDAYNYLYNKKRLVSGNYLYNSNNNITMGSAYLHILYYKYLRKIKNPQSRLYCTIAAYNTGAGNVAWVFVKTYSMDKASKIINKMTPEEVYTKLLHGLKYKETRIYLQKVNKRVKLYNKLYANA